MSTIISKIPPICLGLSLARLIIGKLRFSRAYIGQKVRMGDGQEYTIFRHVSRYPEQTGNHSTVFIVNFRFSRLSYKANKVASILPMLLITGFPGFRIKMYAVNESNGFWQGMYEWETEEALKEYKGSFVYRIMNKRALNGSVHSYEFPNTSLEQYIKEIIIPT
ncbi:hypothetical protein ACFLTA_05195 [Bacteroidota bacterium]